MENPKNKSENEELRRKAEELLNQSGQSAWSTSDADVQALVHELQVHQIELEMQNEELQHVNAELDEALRQYSDLYEFAPVGYFMLDDGGAILNVNLAGAQLLGTERSKALGARFQNFVDPSSLSDLKALLANVLTTGKKHSCEVKLRTSQGDTAYALIKAVLAGSQGTGSTQFRMSVTDVTERNLAQKALQKAHDDLETRVAQRASELAQSNEALRKSEEHKLEFYRRTIAAATDGKLLISEKQEIEQVAGLAVASWKINSKEDAGAAAPEVGQLIRESGMEEQRAYEFLGCITEAVTNVLKHANEGTLSLHRATDSLICVISDTGPGIGPMAFPDVALTPNYSTAGTLGMGYKLIIHFADRVYLATGPEGTTVAIEMGLHKNPRQLEAAAPSRITGWASE